MRPSLPVLVPVVGVFASCISGGVHVYSCDDPCGNGEPGWTCDDPCADVERCPGECVPAPALGFDGPVLLWVGNEIDAPPCPDRASRTVYEGLGDLDDSNQCGCACGPAACALPSGVTGSTELNCPHIAQGATYTSIGAPPGWDGSCMPTPDPSGDVVGTVGINATALLPCMPVADVVPTGGLGSPWGSFARACMPAEPFASCRDPNQVCAPSSAPPPEGFTQCILSLREGDVACPDGYPDKRVFYDDLEDTRSCSPCTCGPPSGGTCTAEVTLYADSGCSMSLGNPNTATEMAECHLVQMPGPLGSMKATFITNEPGACSPGGGNPSGEARPVGPSLFCCRSTPGGSG